jgi:gamma-glutamyl-gamma-aminobutyrate hydrolase PuuD
VIEGIERPDAPFVIGLQCHPEALSGLNPTYQELFRRFVNTAATPGS